MNLNNTEQQELFLIKRVFLCFLTRSGNWGLGCSSLERAHTLNVQGSKFDIWDYIASDYC